MLDDLTTPSGGTVPVYAATVPVRKSGVSKTQPRGRRATILLATAAAVGFAAWIWSARPRTKPAADAPAATASIPAPVTPTPPTDSARSETGSTATPASEPEPAPATRLPAAAPTAPKKSASADAALLARLRGEARTARQRAASQGAAGDVLARGDSAVARADSLEKAHRPTEAGAELSVAIAIWRNAPAAPAIAPPAPEPAVAAPVPPSAPPVSPAPPVPPPDPAPKIRALFDAYAAAVETRSIDAIRAAYPGITDKQVNDWRQFFKAVNDIRVGLQVTKLDVRGDVGDVELAGVYVFSDPGTRRTREDSVSFHSTVRRDARGWRIESLH